jgi:hypothetical protein
MHEDTKTTKILLLMISSFLRTFVLFVAAVSSFSVSVNWVEFSTFEGC